MDNTLAFIEKFHAYVGRGAADALIVVCVVVIFLILRIISHFIIKDCVLHYSIDRGRMEESITFIQRVGELPIVALASFGFILGTIYFFNNEDFMNRPFTYWKPSTDMIFSIFLGYLICELFVKAFSFPLCYIRFSYMIIHILIGITSYVIILHYQSDALLGVLGLLVQYPMLHGKIYRVIKPNSPDSDLFNNPDLYVGNLIMWMASVLICSITVPVVVVFKQSIFSESATHLHIFEYIVLVFIICYYVFISIIQCCMLMYEIYQHLLFNCFSRLIARYRRGSEPLLGSIIRTKSSYGTYQRI